ncbi:hypothetical protein KEM55_006923, partial [Ascosphaera atra]
MARAEPLRTITDVYTVDNGRAVIDQEYAKSFSEKRGFVCYNEGFKRDVLGDSPELVLVSARYGYGDKNDWRKSDFFAHEAGLYIRSTDSIYFTSNYQTSDPKVDLYSIDAKTWEIKKLDYPE